jgi:fimbrial chaperone protein
MSVAFLVPETTIAGAASKGGFVVVNDSEKSLSVEIDVLRINLDENGNFASEPARDKFLIFPRRADVPPGSRQKFFVQWVGDPHIKTSQSYIISVNEVPTMMPKGRSGVQVVFNFTAVMNIAPMTGSSAIILLNSGVENDDKGKSRPTVTVQNPGNIHAKLTDATITLSGGGWSKTMTPDELRRSMGLGLVQPGNTRRFLLPVDLPPNVKDVTASIRYEPTK